MFYVNVPCGGCAGVCVKNVPCGGCAGVWVKDLEDEGVQVCV